MQAPQDEAVQRGQAVYNKATLRVYDAFVLGLSNQFIWKCPTARILRHYDEHVTPNHMDIGVGTGYFLDRCRFSAPPRIVLVDLNKASLAATQKRIARYNPACYVRNVLEPLDLPEEKFASVGMNYLLHCVPGSLEEKAGAAFANIKPYLAPGGVVFGSTLLHEGVSRNPAAQALMAVYNRKGIFHNSADSLAGLRSALAANFPQSGVEVVGCGALFWGKVGPENHGDGLPLL